MLAQFIIFKCINHNKLHHFYNIIQLEDCEAERSRSEYQPQDERAEHPSNMPLPITVTLTMNRMQAAVDARRLVGRREHNSVGMPVSCHHVVSMS